MRRPRVLHAAAYTIAAPAFAGQVISVVRATTKVGARDRAQLVSRAVHAGLYP